MHQWRLVCRWETGPGYNRKSKTLQLAVHLKAQWSFVFVFRGHRCWCVGKTDGFVKALWVASLVVSLEETNSGSIFPVDLSAHFTGWDSGSAKAQVSGSSNGNTYSGSQKAADLRVGEVPLLS